MAMLRSRGEISLMTWPSKRSWPAVADSSPEISRSRVVFPHPEGPTNTTNSPSAISRSTSLTATVPSGKTLLIPLRPIAPIGSPYTALTRPQKTRRLRPAMLAGAADTSPIGRP